jgi:hypothetical protein
VADDGTRGDAAASAAATRSVPRLVHIRAGRGRCLTCGFASNRLKQLGDPVQAVADMQAEG